jgi:hypothetical protein
MVEAADPLHAERVAGRLADTVRTALA